MLKIEIAYDPYQMKLTTLKIDGKDIIHNASGYEKISNYAKQQIPLQSWIDPIPYAKWNGLLSEAIGNSKETEVECYFTGRKMDLDDLKESFNSVNGVSVSYPEENTNLDDWSTKKAIDKAYNLIIGDDFRRIVEDSHFSDKNTSLQEEYKNLPEKYKEALDGTFHIVFAGMYSSGKSTVINALIGKDLLPTSDGTCTSKVFKIKNDPKVKYARMRCLNSEGNIVVDESDYTEETLKKRFAEIFPRGENNELLPSNPPDIETVEIFADLSRLYPPNYGNDDLHLEIIDTPGVDSGVGNREQHDKITESVIRSPKKDMVIFCVKAATPEQKDIQDFLEMADEHQHPGEYDQRFLFVLNRADECSFKEDESWEKKLRGLKEYYAKRNDNETRNMCNLRFFPTSALGALCVRRGRTVDDSDYESILSKYYSRSNKPMAGKANYHFDEQCATSQHIKNAIKCSLSENEHSSREVSQKQALEVEYHSGIVSLEMAIQDYIAKYAFPLKLQDLLRTFATIFKEIRQLSKKVEKEFNNASTSKKEKEKQEEEQKDHQKKEEENKARLDEVFGKIDKAKNDLDNIKGDFNRNSEKDVVDLETKMKTTIDEILYEVDKNNHDRTERLREIIDNTQRECESKINENLNKSRGDINRIEDTVNSCFREISEIYYRGEGFHIEETTGFKRIETDGISAAQGAKVRNPKYRECFGFAARLREKILNIGRAKTVYDSSVIDIQTLKEKLRSIETDFALNVDAAFSATKNSLENAVGELQGQLDRLKAFVKDYDKKLKDIREKVENACADHESAKKLAEDLEKINKTLQTVEDALSGVPQW